MPPFDELLHAREAVRSAAADSKEPPTAETGGGSLGSPTEPLTAALLGDGSTKRVMVGSDGIEPPTLRV
jgi:hypothetical protein